MLNRSLRFALACLVLFAFARSVEAQDAPVWPEWIQPGANVVYEADAGDHKLMSYTVLSVSKAGVLVRREDVVILGNGRPWVMGGSQMLFYTPETVRAFMAFFTFPQALREMTSRPGTLVARGTPPEPYREKHPQVTAITLSGADRTRTRLTQHGTTQATLDETDQYVQDLLFDSQTGVKMLDVLRAGDGAVLRDADGKLVLTHTGAAGGNAMRLIAIRQVPVLSNTNWQPWAGEVSEITYSGSTTTVDPVNNLRATNPIAQIYTLRDTIGDVRMGTVVTLTPDPVTGRLAPGSPSTIGVGRGGESLWLDTHTLKSLKPGTIFEDKILHCVTSYERTPELGVVTTRHASGDYIQRAYDLKSGLLIRFTFHLESFTSTSQLQLEGYR